MKTCLRSQFETPCHRLWLRWALPLLAFSLVLRSAPADSLWQDDTKPMLADKRAAAIGDIITIIVQENNTASKDNKTKTGKETGVDASITSFLYSPASSGMLTHNGALPALKAGSKSDFAGGGSINNSEQIIARIAVRVVEVLPNKSMIIEGTRETSFGGEQQTMVLRGTVRSEDIASNNTVYSFNIADANIKITTKGTISDSQKKGWFTRVWDKITPF
jgi:flagellar L-ring protein precursor FlgH